MQHTNSTLQPPPLHVTPGLCLSGKPLAALLWTGSLSSSEELSSDDDDGSCLCFAAVSGFVTFVAVATLAADVLGGGVAEDLFVIAEHTSISPSLDSELELELLLFCFAAGGTAFLLVSSSDSDEAESELEVARVFFSVLCSLEATLTCFWTGGASLPLSLSLSLSLEDSLFCWRLGFT